MRIIDEDTVRYRGLNGKSDDYKAGYFDAMAAHDEDPTVINNITRLRPKTDDVIVVSYNMSTIDFQTMNIIHSLIVANFPDNKVFALPDDACMECCDENVLNRYIESIQAVIQNHKR